MGAAVEFADVSVRFGSRQVLKSLNLEVRQGETLVLLGRSGSGKTTALKLVNRLLVPERGKVSVLGKPVDSWEVRSLRQSIGYVIQHAGLFPHMTVSRNVALPLDLKGSADRESRTDQLLDLVGLPSTEFRHRYPNELSGGQQQRVSVARALATDPPILLLDEPFGSLDPITRLELQKQFLALKKRLGTTAILVTHDLTEAERLGDRIAVLHEGALDSCVPADRFAEAEGKEAEEFREAFWQPR